MPDPSRGGFPCTANRRRSSFDVTFPPAPTAAKYSPNALVEVTEIRSRECGLQARQSDRLLLGCLSGSRSAGLGLVDEVAVRLDDNFLRIAVEEMDLHAVVLQVLDALAIHRGVRVLDADPHLLDPREDDPLGAAELRMTSRPRRARLERAEQHRVVELAVPVPPFEERVFRVVTIAQLAPARRLHGAIRLPQHCADEWARLAIAAPLSNRLLHHADRQLHQLPWVELLLDGHREPPQASHTARCFHLAALVRPFFSRGRVRRIREHFPPSRTIRDLRIVAPTLITQGGWFELTGNAEQLDVAARHAMCQGSILSPSAAAIRKLRITASSSSSLSSNTFFRW